MISLIIGLAVVVVGIVLNYVEQHRKHYKDFVDHMVYIFSPLAVGIVIFCALSLFGGTTGTKEVVDTKDTNNLKALNVNPEEYGESSGGFFLIAGAYHTENGIKDYVKFIEEVRPGVYQMQKVEAENILLTETGKKPIITKTTYKNIKVDTTWSFWNTDMSTKPDETIINVPKGTIITDYEVNGDEVDSTE